jgi:hypothetical protein
MTMKIPLNLHFFQFGRELSVSKVGKFVNSHYSYFVDSEDDLDTSGSAYVATTGSIPGNSNEVGTGDQGETLRGPSVIFPSIQNKPIFVNSSFTYDTGRNLNGITVR